MIIHCNAQQEGNGWRISGYCTSHQFFHQREFTESNPGELRESIRRAGRGNLNHQKTYKNCCRQRNLRQQFFTRKIKIFDKHTIHFQNEVCQLTPKNRRLFDTIQWFRQQCRPPIEERERFFHPDFHRAGASSDPYCSFRRFG